MLHASEIVVPQSASQPARLTPRVPHPRTYYHRAISSRAGVASRAMAYVRSDGTSCMSRGPFVGEGCLLMVLSYCLLVVIPSRFSPPTHRHCAGQKELCAIHHGRVLGFLQCYWLILFHILAIHAGGATCPGARTPGCTQRGEQQQRWDRGRRRQQHVATPGRQHSRSTSILSSHGAGWRVLWRGLWLKIYEGC